jgi:hypothetical protein
LIHILAALAVAGASAPTTAAPPSAEVATADAWLALLDAGRWLDSWTAAGELFKSHVQQSAWSSSIQPLRAPLGVVFSRTVQAVTTTSSLPGAPPGDYEVIQFQTDFAKKPQAVETVILAHEGSAWKVDGYFIK